MHLQRNKFRIVIWNNIAGLRMIYISGRPYDTLADNSQKILFVCFTGRNKQWGNQQASPRSASRPPTNKLKEITVKKHQKIKENFCRFRIIQ